MRIASLVVGVVLLLPGIARAQSEEPQKPPPRISATLSPVHLILPVVEITVEARVSNHVGVAIIGGAGSVTSGGSTASVAEIGGQLDYYPFAPFSGAHIGVEPLYVHGSSDSDSTAVANGLSFGPFIGYKFVASFGLTLVAQLGVGVQVIKAHNTSTESSDKTFAPILNLNAGWSF
jgi:hypothetical protein